MQPLFLYLVIIFSFFHTREKKDFVWLFKQSDKACITYDFEHNTTKKHNAFENGCQLERIAKEIQENSFSFNPQNDTVLVCLQFVDDLVFSCKSFFSRKYYAPPTQIDAFSSKGELHLRLIYDTDDSMFRYNACDEFRLYEKTDYMTQLLLNNNIEGFIPFYTEYGLSEQDVTHTCSAHHIRIEIKDGRIQSVTDWVFLLDWFEYRDSDIE